jgi:NTP pyrophosphatase (non-canonical NTP hydrolase)
MRITDGKEHIIFAQGDEEFIRFEADGSIFIRGEKVDSNVEVYTKFCEWLEIAYRATLTLSRLQREVGHWSRQNFPKNQPYHPLLGACEEIGELCHAHLKAEQGIRGTPAEHRAAGEDAVGDVLVYLADYCERMGYDFQDALVKTWEQVKKRDWTKNRATGTIPEPTMAERLAAPDVPKGGTDDPSVPFMKATRVTTG